MKEIRLCWIATRERSPYHEAIEYGEWCHDTVAARQNLQDIVDAGIKVWGPESHWLQEREVETL